MTENVTLRVNGQKYSGWTDMHVSRGIDRAVGDFECSVSERWLPDGINTWQIRPFDGVQIFAGDDLILTGYVDEYSPSLHDRTHTVRISGRSKTEDLVDCSCELLGGQFIGAGLDTIARAVCKPFGIGVVIKTGKIGGGFFENQADEEDEPTGGTIIQTMVQKGERAFAYLERLGRLRGILLTDDEYGNLVLTDAGGSTASTTIIQGKNVVSAEAKINVSKQFQDYIVYAQSAVAPGVPVVQNEIQAKAHDPSVPRPRTHSVLGEGAGDPGHAQLRANWMMHYAAGRTAIAHIVLQGWRQADGTLWRPNQMVSCNILNLNILATLLVVKVSFIINASDGFRTELELGPIDGYRPDPGQIKMGGTGWWAGMLNPLRRDHE